MLFGSLGCLSENITLSDMSSWNSFGNSSSSEMSELFLHLAPVVITVRICCVTRQSHVAVGNGLVTNSRQSAAVADRRVFQPLDCNSIASDLPGQTTE